jgi:signal transduction histidine kinase
VRSRSKKVPVGPRLAEAEQAPGSSAFGRADAGPMTNGAQDVRADVPAPGGGPQHQAPGRRPAPRSGGLKNWRVRSRLLLLITIPTLTAVVLGGIRITSSVQSALAYQRVLQLATLSSDITNLVQRLQDERDQTAYFIAEGNSGGRSASTTSGATGLQVVYTQRRETEAAAAVVEADLARVGGSFSNLTRQEASAAVTDLAGLPNLRLAATQSNLPALVVVQKYGGLIGDLLVLEDSTAQGASDATLSQTVRVLGLVSRMKEDVSQQRAILTAALIQRTLNPAALQALTSAQSDQLANLSAFNLSATTTQRQIWNTSVANSLAPLASSEEQQAIALQSVTGGSLRNDPTTADDLYGAMSNVINFQMGSVERTLVSSIIARTQTLLRGAVIAALVIAAAVVVVLGLALLFTVVVARSMVRPLRRLRAGALEVAGVRLPETVRRMSESDGAAAPLDVEPIDVDSSDEIGEVARAFDQVHREALRLASNEAALRGNVNAMFVNLSRRSQSLVERQIRLIDDLEQGEQDAERLANLFQMDHLATRMRRNSENLLVLAGHEVSRRWTQSVALVDVLRAAVSEIEQYERVTLNVQPGISVRGQAVNDVVHLIAELAENASSFSAADTPVKVSGHLLNSGGVLLDITDQGVGMGAEEMAHANWRLDNPPVVDVAVSRRMGLFVVARLAARHGIRVRLRPATAGGLTALVWLPDEVISHETGTAPSGLRRMEAPSPGLSAMPSVSSASTASTFSSGDWPGDSAAPDRSAAAQAVSAARTPRFAPLRPDLGDTAAFTAVGSDVDSPAPASASSAFDTSAPPAYESSAPSAYETSAPADYETSTPSAYETSAPADYETSTPAAYESSAPAAYESSAPSAYETSAPAAYETSAPSAYSPSGTSSYDSGGRSAFDTAGTSAYDTGTTSMLGTGAMPAAATGPLPVFGAPTRSEEKQFGSGSRTNNDLPFRTQPSAQRGVIVPPAVGGSGEEHRLPIFESVESDWFRRGRHGAARTGQVASTTATSSWTSPADEGWRAAEAAHVPTSGGVTLSGLPKRVPKANLVPGTVGAETSHAPAAPAPTRSAAQARERLASFQRGVREGRAAVRDGEVPSGEDNSAS